MKKFTFRLQNVLDARENALKDRQLELALLQKQLNEQLEILVCLGDKLRKTGEGLNDLLQDKNNINLSDINIHQNYIEKLNRDIVIQKEIIKNIKELADAKQKEVIEALKAKTILEKLKEKDKKAYLKQIDYLETLELDEIALVRSLQRD